MSEPSERDGDGLDVAAAADFLDEVADLRCSHRVGSLRACWGCRTEFVARWMVAARKDAERLREAEGLIREVEWSPVREATGVSECPSCDSVRRNGHEPDCRLARWLEGVQGEVTEGIPSCPSCGHRGWECRRCADWIGAQP